MTYVVGRTESYRCASSSVVVVSADLHEAEGYFAGRFRMPKVFERRFQNKSILRVISECSLESLQNVVLEQEELDRYDVRVRSQNLE